MRAISHTPTYNLKAVLKETGLTADVLRAWERRYGVPMPHRTAGGHRLYSQYDVETVKWLRARQAAGLSISRAVESWKELTAAGRDPLVELSPAGSSPMPGSLPAAQPHLEVLRRSWLEAALSFDARKADEVLNQAFAMYPPETVCIEILQRGLHRIGADWYLDQVTVQQEHFASALAVRRLETLITLTPRPTRAQKILTGCPPGEWHTFPVLLLSLLLRRNGLNVVYLGADIPIDRWEETAAAIRPDLVVLAAQQLTTAATLQSAALALQDKGIPLAYGGLIFNRIPALCQRIPAHFLGADVLGAVALIERLVLTSTLFNAAGGVDGPYRELARLYREKRPMIESGMYALLSKGDLDVQYLLDANTFFGDELAAALELGSPALLEADLEWVKRLLTGRQISAGQLVPFLTAYSQMIQNEMGSAGDPIRDWIAGYLQQNGTTPSA